jgi:hypothetical protein
MLRTSVNQSTPRSNPIPDDLTSQIQAALVALADLETRYQMDRDALLEWTGPGALKRRFVDQLEAHHAREQEPLVQRLAALHQHMTTAAMFRDLHVTH